MTTDNAWGSEMLDDIQKGTDTSFLRARLGSNYRPWDESAIAELKVWLGDELLRMENELSIILPERMANYKLGKKVGKIMLCREILARLEEISSLK